MYKVIRAFHDLQDFTPTKGGRIYHKYNPGDEFPRKGMKVSEDRIEELSSEYNAQGKPLIEEVYNGTATDPTLMTKAQLVQFAKDNNIEIDQYAKKAEILDQVMTAPADDEPTEDDDVSIE